MLSDYLNQVILKQDVSDWFIKRHCRIKFVRIDLEVLCEANFEHTILNNIELCLGQYASFRHTASLQNQYINEKVFCVKIKSDQDPAVMEVLFSLLSSVRSLDIRNSYISQWMEHIKTEYCPNLEKLNLYTVADVSQSSDILQSIANNCPHLHNLDINLK